MSVVKSFSIEVEDLPLIAAAPRATSTSPVTGTSSISSETRARASPTSPAHSHQTASSSQSTTLSRRRKAGYITEDERKSWDNNIPDGVSYVSWLKCEPEMAEIADLDMFVFDEDLAKAFQTPSKQVLACNAASQTTTDNGSLRAPSGILQRGFSVSLTEQYTKLVQIVQELDPGLNLQVNERNVFHALAIFGWRGLMKHTLDFIDQQEDSELRNGLSHKDIKGFTPLHYIAWHGRYEILQVLISRASVLKLGKCLHETTESGRNALHLCARNGHTQTLNMLICYASQLSGCKLADLLTKKDSLGLTPLHLAALHGREQVTHLLLKNGACADQLDRLERTALHISAIRGHTSVGRRILECQGKNVIDMKAKDGFTALVYACLRDHGDFVSMLLDHGANLRRNDGPGRPVASAFQLAVRVRCRQAVQAFLKSNRWEEAFAATGEDDKQEKEQAKRKSEAARADKRAKDQSLTADHITSVLAEEPELFELLLDRLATEDEAYDLDEVLDEPNMQPKKPLKQRYLIRCLYHQFSHSVMEDDEMTTIHSYPDDDDRWGKYYETSEDKDNSLCIVQKLLNYAKLRHLMLKPVIVRWMKIKWKLLRWLIFCNLFLYSLFLIFLTISVTTVIPFQRCPEFIDVTNLGKYERGTLSKTSSYIALFLAIVRVILEFFEWWNRKCSSYFSELSNYMELTLYVMAIIFTSPKRERLSQADWTVGMIALTLAWVNLLLFLQRLPFFGVFIQIFKKILQTFLRVLAVYALFILGFSFAFYILFSEMRNFENIERALATTLASTRKGLDLTGFFSIPPRQMFVPGSNSTCSALEKAQITTIKQTAQASGLGMLYPIWTWVYLLIFFFIGPTILTNMLTGLAVDDISEIRKKALETLSASQANLILEQERVMQVYYKYSPRLRRIIDKLWLKPSCDLPDGQFSEEIFHRGTGVANKECFNPREIPIVGAILEMFSFNLGADRGISLHSSFFASRLDSLNITNKHIAKTMLRMGSQLNSLNSSHNHLTKIVSDLGVDMMESVTFDIKVDGNVPVETESTGVPRTAVTGGIDQSARTTAQPQDPSSDIGPAMTDFQAIASQLNQQQFALATIKKEVDTMKDTLTEVLRLLQHSAPAPSTGDRTLAIAVSRSAGEDLDAARSPEHERT